MTKELQDLAWSILPKEFKEEVKKEYRKGYVCETLTMLITLFGYHNLTSDAEGEEMLCVKASKVREMYALNENILYLDSTHKGAILLKKKLTDLFGSKCLPDNVATSAPNVDSSHGNIDSLSQNPPENCNKANHISTDDSKPAEPTDFGREVNFPTKKQSRNFSQETANCDNRLQIAAMAMQGMLANTALYEHRLKDQFDGNVPFDADTYIADMAVTYADALLSECEKGGNNA